MVPAGFEWTMTLAAGREHYLFGGHDSLYARCSGLSRQSLWLGQIGPPPVCKSMSMSMPEWPYAAWYVCMGSQMVGWKQGGGSGCHGQSGCVSGAAAARVDDEAHMTGGVQLDRSAGAAF